MIQYVLLAGLAVLVIKRDALSMPEIQQKSTNDVVSIIESREMARNATPLSSVNAMSSYKQVKQPRPPAAFSQRTVPSQKQDLNPSSQQTIPCPECCNFSASESALMEPLIKHHINCV